MSDIFNEDMSDSESALHGCELISEEHQCSHPTSFEVPVEAIVSAMQLFFGRDN